jgi:hypothetical protein
MPGLVPGIYVLLNLSRKKTWMAGTSPAMTSVRAVPYTRTAAFGQ